MKAIPLVLAAGVLLTTVHQASAQIEVSGGRTLHCTAFFGRERYFCDRYEIGSDERDECDLFESNKIIRSTMHICGYMDESQDSGPVNVELGPPPRQSPPSTGEPGEFLPPPQGDAPEPIGSTPPPPPPRQGGAPEPIGSTPPPPPPPPRTPPPPEQIPSLIGTESLLKRGLYDLDALKNK
ncbi:hypothetical protein BGZ68_000717 [Mortierella alpina]|nr:hypothetical protein BGZ68_000717 [Mortierella alpina]